MKLSDATDEQLLTLYNNFQYVKDLKNEQSQVLWDQLIKLITERNIPLTVIKKAPSQT